MRAWESLKAFSRVFMFDSLILESEIMTLVIFFPAILALISSVKAVFPVSRLAPLSLKL